MPFPRVEYTEVTAGPTLKVVGLKETMEMFQELPKIIVLGGFNRALDAAGQIIEDAIEAKTPTREIKGAGIYGLDFGALKGDIYHTVELDSNYRGGRAIITFRKYSHIANFVEYGHRMLSHSKRPISGPKTAGGMVRAYPFMRPATEAVREQAVDAFVDVIVEIVNRVRSKAA